MTNNLKLNNKVMSYLLIVMPFLLISGPFLSDLAVVIICLLYLFNFFKKDIKNYLKNFFLIGFLIFYLICILSSALSEYPLVSLFKSILYIRFLIFAFAIAYIIKNNPDTLDKLFISILICFTILIFDGFFQFIFKKNIFGFVMYEARISSFFKDELIYGSYLSKFLPLFLSLFFLTITKNNKLNLLFSAIFFLSILAIAISGERSSLFMTILILIYLLIMLI